MLEPWGSQLDDVRFGTIAAALTNRKGWKEVFPGWSEKFLKQVEEEETTPQQKSTTLLEIFKSLTSSKAERTKVKR